MATYAVAGRARSGRGGWSPRPCRSRSASPGPPLTRGARASAAQLDGAVGLVEAVLPLPAASAAGPRGSRRSPCRSGHPAHRDVVGRAAPRDERGRRAGSPLRVTSPSAKPVTDSAKTTPKWIGLPPVGSSWPAAWPIVTAGRRVSIVQVSEAGSGRHLHRRQCAHLERVAAVRQTRVALRAGAGREAAGVEPALEARHAVAAVDAAEAERRGAARARVRRIAVDLRVRLRVVDRPRERGRSRVRVAGAVDRADLDGVAAACNPRRPSGWRRPRSRRRRACTRSSPRPSHCQSR